ncbi:MAG: CCA tRNA nucleotidyltransferase [Pseudomonadota bacterium]|nr:CCA tRNA nucleotidyltransferase [Pseudomonadota bacterium]
MTRSPLQSPNLQGAPWLAKPQVQRLFEVLSPEGEETRCVGGCVRDTLAGAVDPNVEVDMATTLTPEAVLERLEEAGIRAIATGLTHGTVTAVMTEDENAPVGKAQKSLSENYEITTLRRDVRGDGRHAEVVFGRDWQEDAMRRDLTINAVYADRHGAVYDPSGSGLEDIAAQRVRFIGDPAQRIREDYLRILRFVRFYFRLSPSVPPDAETVQAIRSAAAKISSLSGERRQTEFMKILALAEVEKAVNFLAEVGALETTLGNESRSGDGVWNLARLSALVTYEKGLPVASDALLRLAVLMPDTQTADAVASSLRLSRRRTQRLRTALDHPGADLAQRPQHYLHYNGAPCVSDQAVMALADGQISPEEAGSVLRMAAEWVAPRFPLRGAEMAAAGMPEGPAMGRLLAELEAWWVAQDFPAKRAVEAEFHRRWPSGKN